MPEEYEVELFKRGFVRKDNAFIPPGIIVYMRVSEDGCTSQMVWYYEASKTVMVFAPQTLFMPIKFD